jgi:hypothetical protein
LNAVCGSPLFSPCHDRNVHRLVHDRTMVPGPGPPKSRSALRWTRRRSSIVRSTHTTEWTDTASGQINWHDCHSAESLDGCRLAQKIDHGPCWTRLGHRPEHERAHNAGVAIATVTEGLIELLLVIGGVIVAAALLPRRPKVRLVLGCCGLVLVVVSGALFAFVAYTGETLLRR